MKISFLASHGGSSARAIIGEIRSGGLRAEVGILITNNGDADIYHWCQENTVDALHISSSTHGSDRQADQEIAKALEQAGTDLVVCSGYMKKVGPATLARFPGGILNIHPALLPRFGGKGMFGDRVHRAVLKAGEFESGACVHIVTEGYDEGPILKQVIIPVQADDTVASLRARVQAMEPDLYIATLKEWLEGH